MSAKCFVDSNIWLYAFMDSNSDKRTNALQLIESPDIVLSTQVINEVCCNLLRKADYSEAEIQQTIRNFQARYPILNVTADVNSSRVYTRESLQLFLWTSPINCSAINADALSIQRDTQNAAAY